MRLTLHSILLAATVTLLVGCESPVAPDPIRPGNPQPRVDVPSTPPVRQIAGCYSAGGSGGVGCGLLQSFGDPTSDANMIAEVQYQSAYWYGVPAQVFVLNDCDQPNAYAPHNEPAILFGRNLFTQLRRRGADLAIIGVLAHEWAHRLQIMNGWVVQRPTVKPMELEADAFAGFYLGLAKGWAWNQVNSFFQFTYELGDTAFNSPSHHGTPQERLAAARLGFDTGVSALLSGRRYTWLELHGLFTGQTRSFAQGVGTAVVPPLDQPAVDPAVRRALYPTF